jgi:site-specific recombinase XerD
MYDIQQIGFCLIAVPDLFREPVGAAKAFTDVLAAMVSPHTDRVYRAAAAHFSAWCGEQGRKLAELDTDAVSTYLEASRTSCKDSTVRQRILCLRKLLQACSDAGAAPAGLFAGVSVSRRTKWHADSALPESELTRMLSAASGSSVRQMRDRALFSMLFSTFLPVGALRRLSVETFSRNPKAAYLVIEPGRYGLRLLCPERLARYLESYIHGAGIGMEPQGYLFRSIAGGSGRLTQRPLTQPDVYRIIQGLAKQAGITKAVSPRQVRAAGIVKFLRNGGDLNLAARLAGHETLRTTVKYAAVGTKRKKHRIAYRLADVDADWEKDLEDDFGDGDWDGENDYDDDTF